MAAVVALLSVKIQIDYPLIPLKNTGATVRLVGSLAVDTSNVSGNTEPINVINLSLI